MEKFKIPVCLFIFQRKDTVLQIIERISIVKPQKLYLISDQGRTEDERKRVGECRDAVEKAIDWDCEVIKDYANKNRGVFQNIGLGALRVFQSEDKAIFLEDDNLPEVSFFKYCEEMLERYQDNDRILWVCGTNYLGKYKDDSEESYMFTQQLLPCGWASWSHKFQKYYDAYFSNYTPVVIDRIRANSNNTELLEQQFDSINRERSSFKKYKTFRSWDFQMIFSIYSNDLLGISPNCNQIKNIGVDQYSEHGGSSFENVMTKRFCGMDSFELEFPLKHPNTILINQDYEKKIAKTILYPFSWRFKNNIKKILVTLLKYDK